MYNINFVATHASLFGLNKYGRETVFCIQNALFTLVALHIAFSTTTSLKSILPDTKKMIHVL